MGHQVVCVLRLCHLMRNNWPHRSHSSGAKHVAKFVPGSRVTTSRCMGIPFWQEYHEPLLSAGEIRVFYCHAESSVISMWYTKPTSEGHWAFDELKFPMPLNKLE